MTTAPADLLALQADACRLTGLAPRDVGIAGDERHQRTGGYHIGRSGLIRIGRYHPNAHPGDPHEDYSARLLRDRHGLTDDASAIDIGDNWPRGGRPAWIRFNNLLVAALHANDPALACVRAVNYTPDGTAKKRTDREQRWAVIASTDSVDTHTHVEFYRDTEGHRAAATTRIQQLIQQAITGGDGDMTPDEHTSLKHVEAMVGAMFTEFRGKLDAAAAVQAKLGEDLAATRTDVDQVKQQLAAQQANG